MGKKRLGVGIIGGGFIGQFHIRSWVGVRDADILGIVDKSEKNAEESAICLQRLAIRLQIEDKPPNLSRVSFSSVFMAKAQENLLEGLLHCGKVKAKLLLEKFDNPLVVFQAIMDDSNKVLEIKGFGEKFIQKNQQLIKDYFKQLNN